MTSEVQMSQVDAAGIVYFARFFEIFHQAYEQLLKAAGEPLASVFKNGVWAAPLRHAEANYIAPLRLGQSLVTQIVGVAVQASEITIAYQVLAKSKAGILGVAATGQTVHTFVNPKTFQRSEVPPQVLATLQSIELSGGRLHVVAPSETSAQL